MSRDARRISGNAIFLFLLTFSNYFVGLLLFPFLSRILSVEGFGLVGFAMSYVLVFQVTVEFGFMISATARVSTKRDDLLQLSRIVTTVSIAKSVLLVFSLGAFILTAQLIPMVREHFLIVFLFFGAAVATAMLPDFYFRGIEKMRTIAVRSVVTKIVAILFVLISVKGDADIYMVPASLLVANLVALGWSFLIMIRHGLILVFPRVAEVLRYLREGSGFYASRLAVAFNQSVGAFFLGLKYSVESAPLGLYSGATRISSAGEMLLTPVTDSLYPHMINRKDYRIYRKIFFVGLVAWFGVCLLVFLFAPQVCVFILGPEYVEAGELLRILLVGTFLAFPSSMLGYPALSPIGLANHANIAILLAALVNAVLFGVLLVIDSINPYSVCAVVASSNLVISFYRGFVLLRYRARMGRV